MANLTEHFKTNEFIRPKDLWTVKALEKNDDIGKALKNNFLMYAKVMETVRCFLQCPFRLTSGVRSPPYNLVNVGSTATKSKHSSGIAGDIQPLERFEDGLRYSDDQLFVSLIYLMSIKAIPTGGIGFYQLKGTVEDDRPSGGNSKLHYDLRGIRFDEQMQGYYGTPMKIPWNKVNNWVEYVGEQEFKDSDTARKWDQATAAKRTAKKKVYPNTLEGFNEYMKAKVGSSPFSVGKAPRQAKGEGPGPLPGLFIYRQSFGKDTTLTEYLPNPYHLADIKFEEMLKHLSKPDPLRPQSSESKAPGEDGESAANS